jgi:acetylornithine deacetylase
VPEFVRRGVRKPLHFALSYDEEVGCIGVRRMIADIVARGIRPPLHRRRATGMELVVAHKGKRRGAAACAGSRRTRR